MSASRDIDYIIAGQGLAGSCMALQLLERGKKILVVDRIRENSATRVAAGLFNPITGKNLAKTWLADELFSCLHTFYPRAEQLTQEKFFNSMLLYRPFVSIEEQNTWMFESNSIQRMALAISGGSPIYHFDLRSVMRFGCRQSKQSSLPCTSPASWE